MSNRIKCLDCFNEEYKKINETKRNNFSKLISKFHNETFIVKEKEDDFSDFFFCSEHFELFLNYFAIIDYEFIKDEFNGLFYIKTSEDRNRIRLSKFDTAVLLILRKLYYIKKKQITSVDKVIVSIDDIIEQLSISQVIKDYKKASYYDDSLRKFRKHKIIDFITSKIDENTNVQILPSIVIIIPQDTLEDIIVRLVALSKESDSHSGGADNENTDED